MKKQKQIMTNNDKLNIIRDLSTKVELLFLKKVTGI